MAVREGLEFESAIESDCAPLAELVMELINDGIEIHCMRDLTRGGLVSALVEITESSGHPIGIDEVAIPVRDDVRGACEILGFDPLYLANEGRFVLFVPEVHAERAVEIMKEHLHSKNASVIGKVGEGHAGVTLKSRIGASRIVDMFTGEQLPRIC
jgi:hydrogenase expression/formation protein HypE